MINVLCAQLLEAPTTGYEDAIVVPEIAADNFELKHVMERDTEVTKDTMHPTNTGSTEDVPPPVVPIVNHESISEPANAPVSASRPNQKASIPFPS
ncbi:hypothetical protein Tco_0736848 [Tanacetum coccineum]